MNTTQATLVGLGVVVAAVIIVVVAHPNVGKEREIKITVAAGVCTANPDPQAAYDQPGHFLGVIDRIDSVKWTTVSSGETFQVVFGNGCGPASTDSPFHSSTFGPITSSQPARSDGFYNDQDRHYKYTICRQVQGSYTQCADPGLHVMK